MERIVIELIPEANVITALTVLKVGTDHSVVAGVVFLPDRVLFSDHTASAPFEVVAGVLPPGIYFSKYLDGGSGEWLPFSFTASIYK